MSTVAHIHSAWRVARLYIDCGVADGKQACDKIAGLLADESRTTLSCFPTTTFLIMSTDLSKAVGYTTPDKDVRLLSRTLTRCIIAIRLGLDGLFAPQFGHVINVLPSCRCHGINATFLHTLSALALKLMISHLYTVRREASFISSLLTIF